LNKIWKIIWYFIR